MDIQDETQKICIGRALAYVYGPQSEFISEKQPIDDINVVTKPSEPGSSFKVRTVHATNMTFLKQMILSYKQGNIQDLIEIKLGPKVGINGHRVHMYLYRFGSKVFLWYRNPWGHVGEAGRYKGRKHGHPMNVLRGSPEVRGIEFCFLEPTLTMPRIGAQRESEECSSSKNEVERRLCACGMGACLAWSEMYTKSVFDWLKEIKYSNMTEITCKEFETNLLRIDSSHVSKKDSLKRISLFSYERWKSSPYVPFNLFLAIYNACPDNKDNLKAIVDAYDVFNKGIARKGPQDIRNVRIFLSNSNIESEDLKNAWALDVKKLEDIMKKLKESRLKNSTLGRFIVRTTMVLCACKIRIGFENKLQVDDDTVKGNGRDMDEPIVDESNKGKGKAREEPAVEEEKNVDSNKNIIDIIDIEDSEDELTPSKRENEIINIEDSDDSEDELISVSRKKQRSSFMSWIK